MTKRILVLAALVALLVLGLAGTALAAEDPIVLTMDLSATRFSGPAEVTVTIRVTNTSDADMPGPLALYTPEGAYIEEFGTPTLAAGQSKTWTGTWTVTEQQIKDGRVTFGTQYYVSDGAGGATLKKRTFYTSIVHADAVAQVEINRYITPSMAAKGQKVSVIYEVVNTGTIDVTDVVIKESSTVSKTEGKIAKVKAGEKQTFTFTVTMGSKDLTSNANITYQAGGKTYTETLGNATIKYGQVKLSASLKADKKGGNPGDTVKLTLTLKNTGKSDYQNVTVTDATLGAVFTGVTVEAGKTITLDKEITIAQSASYQFTVTGTDASGATVETATDRLTVTATDPTMAANLTVQAQVDTPTIYILPDVVTFTVSVTNNASVAAENVTVTASGVTLYTFGSIAPGQTKTFVRDVKVQMQGTFRFDAAVTDQLGDTVTFQSNLVRISKASPTATPSQVPMSTPVLPQKEELPTHDGLPPYVDTLQNALAIGRWVFLGVAVIAVALIAVGAVSRAANAARSNKAPDHLERDGYRSYTDAVSARKRRMMPEPEEDEDNEDDEADRPVLSAGAKAIAAAAEAPAEEESANPAAVSDAMAELYPEAEAEESATYTRRRRPSDEA